MASSFRTEFESERGKSWGTPWFDPTVYELGGDGTLPGLENRINRSLLRGGKRFRPLLMAEFAALFGISTERIIPFARAIEQIHSATLAHDDVIDASDRRRGVPTLNAQIENRKAVLGGDYLLAEGIAEITRQGNFLAMEALALTLQELVTGELLQNEARGVFEVSRSHLLKRADLKTGSLFRWCCLIPALLGEADATVLRLVREFGTRLGVAFQWIDDTLDYSLDSGKPYGQDLREGLVNAVTLRLLEVHPRESSLLAESPWSLAEIESAIAFVRAEAEVQIRSARSILSDLVVSLPAGLTPSVKESTLRLEELLKQLETRKK